MAAPKRINRDTPAFRVIQKCGGFARTAEIVQMSESWVYRWTYDKASGGTGGVIPRTAQDSLLDASRKGLVKIKPADFFEVPTPSEQGVA